MSLSEDARRIFQRMGEGSRLLVERNQASLSACYLVNDPRFNPTPMKEELNAVSVYELVISGLISELTEFGEQQRIGWREAGFDGKHYHVYVCTQ